MHQGPKPCKHENTSAAPVQTPDDEPDTMERLRRAKRRARGEDT
jgi:hypothetical protein